MRPLLRPSNSLLLATYLLLSLTPFFAITTGRQVGHPGTIVVTEIVTWLLVWAIFKRPAYFHWALLPAFLAIPVEIYLQLFFAQGISTHHLGIMAETSPGEMIEFLGNKVWLLLVIAFLLTLTWIATFRLALRTRDLDWNGSSRWIVAGLTIFFILTSQYESVAGLAVAASRKNTTAPSVTVLRQPPDSQNHSLLPFAFTPTLAITDVTTTWPFGITLHAYNFWQERNYLSNLKNASQRFSFGAHQLPQASGPQTVVMVLGESSRFDRWGLNGYARDTTPLLTAETNIVAFSDMVTAVSATRLSVPVIVSRKPATDSLKAEFSEKSFISAFRDAGFKTYWLSNQMSFGKFDTPVSVYANEADVTLFLNLGGMTNNSNFDEVLLDPLHRAMADPTEKKLIVLHTLGNHWNYAHRYPRQFDKWQPSLFGLHKPAFTDLKIKPQMNNSYDNSILYTDWFLAQVIANLKNTAAVTSMLYVADHGQTLYDGACKLAFHGHNTQYEFHVPAIVWYSESYRLTYPEKVDRLTRNRDARLSTENIFHSLLDMADIRYSTEQLDYSFVSRQFKQHKRYVDSYGWTDYDNATFKGDCREVIDKGTPLQQKK